MLATAQIRPAPAFTAARLNALPATGRLTNGAIPPTGGHNMPPFPVTPTPEQLRDVAHYIAQDLFGNAHATRKGPL